MSDDGKRDPAQTRRLLEAVWKEIERQDERYPWPRPPRLLDGPVNLRNHLQRGEVMARCLFAAGQPSFMAVVAEEIGEAARETDPEKRITELVQGAASQLTWAQAIRESMEESE